MSEAIKMEIKITIPPEGWGEVEYRRVLHEEDTAMLWDGREWQKCHGYTGYAYPVARKLPPLWTPSPELATVLKPGWLTRNSFDIIAMHWAKPEHNASDWLSQGPEWRLNAVNPDLLPPLTIPWEKCCFKIGEPKE